MRPESGRSKPRMSLSRTDLPAPLAPRRTRIAPLGTLKSMSRSTTCSSKAIDTCSKTTAAGATTAGSGPAISGSRMVVKSILHVAR